MAFETHVFDRWCSLWLGFSLCFWVLWTSTQLSLGPLSVLWVAWMVVVGLLAGGSLGYLVYWLGEGSFGFWTLGSLSESNGFVSSYSMKRKQVQFEFRDDRWAPRTSLGISRSVQFFRCFWLLVAFGVRIGEARVPGPNSTTVSTDMVWTLGICNPSGLPSKAHLFAQSAVDVWCVSETHLSKDGKRLFMKHLAAENSHYKWCVDGWPVPPRSNASYHGSWCGVAVVSQHPTRSLPHTWHDDVAKSTRIVCTATHVHDLWISGVTVYGVPVGPTHPQAREATSQLLEAAIDRLQCMEGPRFLAGDLNHDIDALPILQKLESLHFCEVQDLYQSRTGIAPRATCKGRTRRDYLYLSPELVALFLDLTLDSTQWADHSTLVASFRGGNSALKRYPWPVPKALPWSRVPSSSSEPLSFDEPTDCTSQYQTFWQAVENRVCQTATLGWSCVPSQCLGRANRLERQTVVGYPAPPKKGRAGEFQPRFFGLSYLHCQWLKQARRLQSYVRICAVRSPGPNHTEHCVSLWQAICHAPGFAPSFQAWWSDRTLVIGDPASIPVAPPGPIIAEAILQAMQLEVRNLEHRLQKSRFPNSSKQRSRGIAQLYASVRRDAPVPVDVLVETSTSQVARVDHDLCALEIEPPASFDANKPIACNGRLTEPIVVTSDKLYLESVEACQQGDIITQTRCTGNLDLIFEAFREQWSRRWNKQEGVPYHHWDTLFAFADARLGRVSAPEPVFQPELLRSIAAGKKAKAAVGLDGVSRQDVLNLNDGELQSICNMYGRSHTSGQWPLQLVQGQVKSLAKKETPGGTGDFRPITIFPFLYRVWSSITSQHWLKHVSPILASHLCGNRSGHRASHLWRAILDEVEESHGSGQACVGVVFDLEKAFNTLPRLVCLGIAKIAGIAHGTLLAWSGALGQMTRSFVVLGSLSPPLHSHCGFAEGCGLSCLAMLLLDQIWHLWVKEASQLCQPLSYVDNWEVVASSPSQLSTAIDATFELAAQLELVVDKAKSFTWATSTAFRRELRGQGYTVKLDTADLGAHVTYSKQLRNASLVARFHNLQDFWVKLRRSFGSHALKAQVVLRAAWPRAMHGISATGLGRKHFHSLRCAYMEALKLNRPGANAFAQMHSDGFLVDPHAYAVLQTFRDFRDLGASGWHVQVLADLVHNGLCLPNGSVSQVLLNRVHLLQWAVHPDGRISDQWGSFSLAELNWTELCVRFQAAWHRVVEAEVAHRMDFQGFQMVDVASTRRVLAGLTPYEQGIMRHNLNGATLTNRHAYHWSDNGSLACVHCGQDDSLEHRYWSCPFSLDLRQQLGDSILARVPSLPSVCTVRSWHLRSALTAQWWTYLLSVPSAFPPPLVTFEGRDPIDFFTDGSCFHQDVCTYRVAAWAVCYVTKFEDMLNAGHGSAQVVGSAVLGGLVQTAFRAELTAVCAALTYGQQSGRDIRIWTDCLGVVRKYTALVQGHGTVRRNSSNADLWFRILDLVDCIGAHRIQVIKVAAHQNPDTLGSEHEKWIARNNATVDWAARAANLDRPPAIWNLWERLVQDTVHLQTVCNTIVGHQLRVAQRWSAAFENSNVIPAPRAPRLRAQPMMGCDLQPRRTEPPYKCCRQLGDIYAKTLFDWWLSIIEPESETLQWVSFAQLYLHFQLMTRHPGCIRDGRRWRNPQGNALLQPENHSFRTRSRWFRMQLQLMWKASHWKIRTATTRPFSSRILCFVGSCSIPAKLGSLQHVDAWLEQKARPIQGQKALDQIPLAW